jgi:hypothetical protein
MAGKFGTMTGALAAGAGIAMLAASAPTPAQASTCGPDWAVPGKYKIAGSFRGKKESTNAFLGKDCRITLQVPGVFTGGKVRARGQCLEFSFKVEGDKKLYRAKWCDDYGLVPWKGKTIRAAVTPLFKRSTGTKKTNF